LRGASQKRQREAGSRTPEEIAELVWKMFSENPMSGRHRIAMTWWALGVIVEACIIRKCS